MRHLLKRLENSATLEACAIVSFFLLCFGLLVSEVQHLPALRRCQAGGLPTATTEHEGITHELLRSYTPRN